MASRTGSRIFAGFGAVLFLVTSSALTVLVIFTVISSSKSSSSTNSTSSSSTAKNASGTKLSGFTPVPDASVTALKTVDTKIGTGAVVKASDTVTVDYTGAVASTGVIFQSTETSGGQPASLTLSQTIPGFEEGIPGMKVGGSRELLIPSNLAYGASPPAGSGIPVNAALVFDVTVDKITTK